MFQYVALTNGTTTLELTDGISYALVSYAPGIPSLRTNELGSEGPYESIVDTMTVHALGCTAADAYAAAGELNRMLDLAARWWENESAITGDLTAVVLSAQVQDSALLPLRAAVKGRASGAANMTLQPVWSAFHSKYMIQNIALQFIRRGQWIGADSSPAPSAAAFNPTAHSVTFADDWTTASPAKVTIGGFANVTTAFSGIIAVADSLLRLTIVEAETMAPVANWASVVDANARGGAVLSYNNAGATNVFTASAMVNGTAYGRRIAIYAALKNVYTVAQTNYQLRVVVTRQGATVRLPAIVIDPTTYTNPQVVFLGVVVFPTFTPGGFWTFGLEASNDVAAGTNALQVDYFVLVTVDDDYTRVVAFSNFVPTAGATQMILDDRILSGTAPALVDNAALERYANYSGDPLVMSRGTVMAAVLAATQGANWRVYNTTPTFIFTTLTAVRHTAYLVPQ